MKRLVIALLLTAVCTCRLSAQVVLASNMDSLCVAYVTPRVALHCDSTAHLSLDGYVATGAVGAPALPVLARLIEMPMCHGVEVSVSHAVYDTLPLELPLSARQPSRSKRQKAANRYRYDAAAYSQPECKAGELFEVEPMGMMRERNLAVLRYAPVRYEPLSQRLIVCRSAEVTVRFVDVDVALTEDICLRYQTPAFGNGETLNTLPLKSVRQNAPVRLTILVPQPFAGSVALQDFVDWKREQGLLVDVLYVSGEAYKVKEQLQKLYDEATLASPAPTYLLLVGDHEQLPAFYSQLSADSYMHEYDYQCDDHVTDHYYTTFTDDNLPDCYIGRLPANDTAQLRTMLVKTMLYEQYAFADDSYLERAVLVAGVDNYGAVDTSDGGFVYADPTMDYAAFNYVNGTQGYGEVYYYKNNQNYAPSGVTVSGCSRDNATRQALLDLYDQGAGWVNYSGHGDVDQWGWPALHRSDVAAMKNSGKPSVMIGNCCLTNHFDTYTCFGESLLRRGGNAGAVAYFGCTNSSFWEEDFIWCVGIRQMIGAKMSPSYDPQSRGVYDQLFHTHGEGYGQQSVTAGRMVAGGVMSVCDRGDSDRWYTTMSEYYWEIYELMGDPTLMPWLGKAGTLPTPVVTLKPNEGELTVSAPNGSYVAIVNKNDLSLQAAAYAWVDGLAYLPLCEDEYDSCFIAITAQGYRPFRMDYADAVLSAASAEASELLVAPNPVHGFCTVSGASLRKLTLADLSGRTVREEAAQSDVHTMNLAGMAPGVYLLRVVTAEGVAVKRIVVD